MAAAANDNVEKLVWLYEAQNKDVMRKLNQIERKNKVTFTKSSKQVRVYNKELKKAASFASQFALRIASLGGISAGAGLAGIATAARQAAASIGEMSSEAKRAGISFEAFQELQYATAKSRVSVDALTDGLKEMQLRADEFITTGKGSGADAFARLGFDAVQLAEDLKKPDALFETIIGRLQHLDKAAQIRIADEIFGGTGGEQFVQLLDSGVAGLRQARKEARDLGLVLSQDVADRAAEVNEKFNTLTSIIGTNLKSAVVDVASLLTDLLDDFREVQALSSKAQQRRMSENSHELSNLDAKLSELDKKLAASRLNTSKAFIQKQIDETRQDRQRLIDENNEIIAAMQSASQISQASSFKVPVVATDPAGKPRKGGGIGRSTAARDAELQAKAVRDHIASLQAEYDAIGKTAGQQRTMNELRRAGAGATAEEKLQITELVAGIEQAAARQESLNFISQQFEQLGMNSFSVVTDQIKTGNAALDQFLKTMIEASAQAAFFGSGPLAGLFGGGKGIGGILGGFTKLLGFDQGGFTGNLPASAVAGVVHGGEYVFSKSAVDRLGLGNLDALHKGVKGFAKGGFVGPSSVVPGRKQAVAQRTIVQVVPSDLFDVVVDNRAGAVVGRASPGIINSAVGQANNNVPAAMAMHRRMGGGDYRLD